MKRPSKLNGSSWLVHAFDREVDALPQALDRLRRIGVGREDFVGHAAHETDIEPTARYAVDHRHLFGDAQRVAAVGDRIAENADAAFLVWRARIAADSGAATSRQVAVW